MRSGGELACLLAKLDNQTARYNEGEAQPGWNGHVLSENHTTDKNADQREESNVNSKYFGKVPLDDIYKYPVATQHQATANNEGRAGTTQPFANERISANFQNSRRKKDKPNEKCHDLVSLVEFVVESITGNLVFVQQANGQAVSGAHTVTLRYSASLGGRVLTSFLPWQLDNNARAELDLRRYIPPLLLTKILVS